MSVPATWALFRRTAGEGNHSPGEWKDTGLRDDVATNLKRRWIEQGGTTDWQEFNYRLVFAPTEGAADMKSFQLKMMSPDFGPEFSDGVLVRLTILDKVLVVERRGLDARRQESWIMFDSSFGDMYDVVVHRVTKYLSDWWSESSTRRSLDLVDIGILTRTYPDISGKPHDEWTPPQS